jgi:phosphocarrier protein
MGVKSVQKLPRPSEEFTMQSEDVVRRQVKVTPEDGLHLRPITLLVRCATTFSSSISLFFDGHRADAKSAFDLMLMAVPSGAILNMEVAGTDAEAAADAVCRLFEDGFAVPGTDHR